MTIVKSFVRINSDILEKSSKSPNKRIEDLIKSSEGGVREFSKKTKSSEKTWYRAFKDGYDLTSDQLMDIYKNFGVTPNELLLGIENELLSDFVTIDFFPNIRASAGHGLLAQDEEPLPIKFRSVFVRQTLKSSPNNLFAMKAKGDSMAPEIKDGDLLIIDKGRTKVQSENPYLVVLDEQVLVKKVRVTGVGSYELISENKEYPPQSVTNGDGFFRILGEVKHIQRTLN